MNYRRAAIAAGAGVAALFIILGTILAVFAATFDLASAFAFGGGSSEGEQAMWVVVPPAAVGFGSALLALALGAGRRRLLICAGVGFVTAVYVSFKEIVPYNPLLDHEARFIVAMFLLVIVLSMLIVTVRRPDIPSWRIVTILAFSVVSAVSGTVALFTTTAGVSLIVASAIWVVLPAVTGLLLPDLGRETGS